MSQQVFGLGEKSVDQKQASLSTVVFIGCFLLVGCVCFWLFNGELKRSKLENLSLTNYVSIK